MKEFILDKNVDIDPSHQEYPKYFFDDLRKSPRVRLVVGGSGYKKEIKEKTSLLTLISELISAGKVRPVKDESVDSREKELQIRILGEFGLCPAECDDHHIFALAVVSGCMNIITKEKRMAVCRDKIRNRIGHNHCPDIRIIRTESAYRDT